MFSHTGGLTGGEVAIAGGASAVGHALLEALLGDDNLRRLAVEARQNLLERVAALYDDERRRFEGVLARGGVLEHGGDELRRLAKPLTHSGTLASAGDSFWNGGANSEGRSASGGRS